MSCYINKSIRHISQNILDNDINLTFLFIAQFRGVLGRIF